jgi:hypothetical protein
MYPCLTDLFKGWLGWIVQHFVSKAILKLLRARMMSDIYLIAL